jgi:peptide deformylase
MAVLEIVSVGGPQSEILARPTTRVRDFGPKLHQLLDRMLETMREAPGVGLAAPQVGVDLRVAVIEYPDDEDDPENTMRVYELINPEIIRSKGAECGQEGCLSIPGLVADVDRATYILLRAQDRNGREFRLKAYDWLARVFQHEIDHLQGVLMTDKATQLYKLVKKTDENGEEGYDAIPIEEAWIGNRLVRAEGKVAGVQVASSK